MTIDFDVITSVWNGAEPVYRHEGVGPEWGLEIANRVRSLNGAGDCIEWGYGGGTVHAAVCDMFKSYTAVDVADRPLALARERGCEAVHARDAAGIAPNSADFVLSTACFQHFPDYEMVTYVLTHLRRALRPGGSGLIQTRYYIPGDNVDAAVNRTGHYSTRFLRSHGMTPWDWLRTFYDHKLTVTAVVLSQTHSQYAWHAVRG